MFLINNVSSQKFIFIFHILYRPTVDEVLNDEFFSRDYMPARLPLSCLTTAPQFDVNTGIISVRRPLGEINREIQVAADARDKIVTLVLVFIQFQLKFHFYNLISITSLAEE